jgi:hypothetical protein
MVDNHHQYGGVRVRTQELIVDVHHLFWYRPVMASLKSFLYGMAPILGLTGAALYERQRALVNLGALEATAGRGPGSGVPLTADNIATVLISVLAAENLSDVNDSVVALCQATPRSLARKQLAQHVNWRGKRKPTFKSELGRVLSKQSPAYVEVDSPVSSIGVTRDWKGHIVVGPGPQIPSIPTEIIEFISERQGNIFDPIQTTAEIERTTLKKLQDLTCFALAAEEGEEE